MAFPRIGGPGIGLTNPLNYPTAPAGAAFTPVKSNVLQLAAGQIYNIPAGIYWVVPGKYSYLQFLDPVSQQWRGYDTGITVGKLVDSDGGNWRLANLTGTPISANVTNAGSGYTNGIGTTATGLTVTASAGTSTWVPIVGGAMGTFTSVAAGAGYTYVPNVVIDAPPPGGLQATAHATLTGGGVSAVTLDNAGAGYSSAPSVTFVNDLRDTAGSGASYTVALTGSGGLTGLYPSNPGLPLTAAPTFTFSPASSTAATAVMNFSVTGYTVSAAGTTYTAPVIVSSSSHLVGGTSILTNPAYTTGTTLPRPARITAALATTTITATGLTVEDGGNGIQTIPLATISTSAYPTIANSASLVLTVGGNTDTVTVQPI